MNSLAMKNLAEWFRDISRRRFVRYGLPFFIFMVGGSFGLREFTQLRYQYSKKEALRPDELKPLGIEMKKPEEVTLETEFEKIKDLDIEHWEPVRGPRPWEKPLSAAK